MCFSPAGRNLVCWGMRLFSLIPVLVTLSLVIVGTRPSMESLSWARHRVIERKLWDEI